MRIDGLAKRLDTIEQETASQSRKWNLVTGKSDTGELDTQARYLDILTNLFSEDDLKRLAFSIGVDYETLSGSGKFGKSLELLKWCRNRGKTKKLYVRIREERPFLFD